MLAAARRQLVAERLVGRSQSASAEVTVAEGDENASRRTAAPALPLAVTLVILFFTYWCVDIVSPAVPAIRESLAMSATGAGLVFSAFFFGRLVSNLPAAWMVERAGPKRTAVVGSLALGIGSVLAAVASSEMSLLPARAVQGLGVALLATAGLLSVLRALPGGGAAMTAFNVSVGVGGSVGLFAGGYLTSEMGWRSIFWLSAAVSIVLLAGSLLARGEDRGWSVERREPETSADKRLIVHRGEAAAIAANLLVYSIYAIWVVSIPLLTSIRFGFDASQVGLLLLFVNVCHLGSAIPVGAVIRRFGAPRALAAGFGICALGLMSVPFVPSALWLLPPMALYAVGQVAGNSSAGDLVLRLGGGGGRAVGAVRLSSDIGLVAGPAAAGAIVDAAGIEASFAVFGALSLSGAIVVSAIMWRSSRWRTT
jgi:MFS family permease